MVLILIHTFANSLGWTKHPDVSSARMIPKNHNYRSQNCIHKNLSSPIPSWTFPRDSFPQRRPYSIQSRPCHQLQGRKHLSNYINHAHPGGYRSLTWTSSHALAKLHHHKKKPQNQKIAVPAQYNHNDLTNCRSNFIQSAAYIIRIKGIHKGLFRASVGAWNPILFDYSFHLSNTFHIYSGIIYKFVVVIHCNLRITSPRSGHIEYITTGVTLQIKI